jgi:hypothetical protein
VLCLFAFVKNAEINQKSQFSRRKVYGTNKKIKQKGDKYCTVAVDGILVLFGHEPDGICGRSSAVC